MSVTALNDLARAKPMIGQRGVTRATLDAKRRAYEEDVQTARAFIKAAGLSPREAFDGYEVATKAMIRSPVVRTRHLREVQRQLGL